MDEQSIDKGKANGDSLHVEVLNRDAEKGTTDGLEPESTAYIIAHMTDSHKEYILQRHGTLEIDPMPSEDPNDPHNWPRWQVSLTCVP